MSSSSQQFTSSSTSYSYTSSSSSSSFSSGGSQPQVTGSRSAQTVYTDPSGTTHVQSAHQDMGQPAVMQNQTFDSQGRELVDGGNNFGGRSIGNGMSGQNRIEDVSETDLTQEEKDRLYEERIEEEYAKREGGA